jgi:3-methylfumaryl-CoA hydratase
MAESLESYKSYIGKSATTTDVVTASVMLKLAATLGIEKAPLDKGEAVPPGWHNCFFPASHRPAQMREDGQASGGGLAPPIPLPRRRIGGTRMTFHEPLRVGDEIQKVTEIADLQIDDGPEGAMVTVIEKSSISTSRGLAVVEERDMVLLSEARAAAAPKASPTVPAEAKWTRVFEPRAPLLFRYSAIRFNSHRIHYDRDYCTKIEKLPGLVVQTSLICQLFIEMCRSEVPNHELNFFGFKTARQTYDTGNFTIAGTPSSDGREATLWSLDPNGNVSMTATAKFK